MALQVLSQATKLSLNAYLKLFDIVNSICLSKHYSNSFKKRISKTSLVAIELRSKNVRNEKALTAVR